MRMKAARKSLDMNGPARDMPFQCAGSKAQAARRFRSAAGAEPLDDLSQAAGDLEIAERVRREPFEIVEFVVQDRLAGGPARRE